MRTENGRGRRLHHRRRSFSSSLRRSCRRVGCVCKPCGDGDDSVVQEITVEKVLVKWTWAPRVLVVIERGFRDDVGNKRLGVNPVFSFPWEVGEWWSWGWTSEESPMPPISRQNPGHIRAITLLPSNQLHLLVTFQRNLLFFIMSLEASKKTRDAIPSSV